MGPISQAWKQILGAVVAGPTAWRTPAEVAYATGRGVEEATDTLADLDAGGWLSVWERPEGPVVTLTPRAAASLGVRLVEWGASEQTRWASAGEPDPPMPRAKGVARSDRDAALAAVPDPAPGPLAAAEHAELLATPVEGAPARWPSRLVGQGLSPWPGPRAGVPPCPACGGRPLRPHDYCLCCDRWGLDLAARPAQVAVVIAARRPDHARVDAPEGKSERDRRRSRRRARFARPEAKVGRLRPGGSLG